MRAQATGCAATGRTRHFLRDLCAWSDLACAPAGSTRSALRAAEQTLTLEPAFAAGGSFVKGSRVLAYLPLHAAGHHTNPGATPVPRTVLDRATSSYTITLRALEHARAHRDTPHAPAGAAVIIAMPTTPEAPDLPGVHDETVELARLLDSPLDLDRPRRHPPGRDRRPPPSPDRAFRLPRTVGLG
jgi:hypothetical protein